MDERFSEFGRTATRVWVSDIAMVDERYTSTVQERLFLLIWTTSMTIANRLLVQLNL
jgi:hypothetical protein